MARNKQPESVFKKAQTQEKSDRRQNKRGAREAGSLLINKKEGFHTENEQGKGKKVHPGFSRK